MPVNGNIGNISYVLCAIVGGILALSDFSGLTIGTLVAFLSLNKSFTQPVTQISQQVSSIVMAMAGAGRVFELCDEKPEVDEGFVELVNVRYNKNNELIETKENTEMWAWKKPAKDGSSAEYTRLAGDVTFDGVDFGYNPDKMVLHDIKMYATPGQKIAVFTLFDCINTGRYGEASMIATFIIVITISVNVLFSIIVAWKGKKKRVFRTEKHK